MAGKTNRILVVDDLPDWRETISGMLTDEGFEVDVAGSSAEALTLLKKSHFDLAVLDMRLDESDEDNAEGLEYLAQEIRDNWPDMKTIVLTGYGTQEHIQQALQPDTNNRTLVDDFMQKTETEVLVQNIQNLLIH